MRTEPAVAGGSHQHDEDSAHQRGYYPPDQNSGAAVYIKLLKDPCPLIGGHTSKGAYERAIVEKEPLFRCNLSVARCVLFAQHQIPLKEVTSFRKKPETKGGLKPAWGYPWVLPENTASWNDAEDLFWK
ncbi:hypothetical protein P3T76_008593 [Phytophthora citrophthora]|uniref:Uncharacterized protein n=1 Tax=Phytophthora citrophthora TaxID=4793 RepID=A0AAD9GIL1_9STRA|nr:hypothetical protein P3T76_008593 [Phytophthora citrophthora]